MICPAEQSGVTAFDKGGGSSPSPGASSPAGVPDKCSGHTAEAAGFPGGTGKMVTLYAGAFAAQMDPAADATDFATRNADALERIVQQRMRDVGVPDHLIGDMPL